MRDVVAAVRRCRWRRDLAVLAAVAALQVAVFALPADAKWQLALPFTDPELSTAFTSHFVHFRVGHLAPNLALYLAVAVAAYALSVAAGRETEFYAAAATFLLAFPVALSALNVVLGAPHVGYGFSGLAMAFVGLLAVRVADRVGAPPVSVYAAGAGAILLYGLPPTPVALTAGVGMLAVALLTGGRALLAGWDLAALLAAALLVASLALAFPGDPTAPGRVTNVYLHALGFGLGALVPYAAGVVADAAAGLDVSVAHLRRSDRPA